MAKFCLSHLGSVCFGSKSKLLTIIKNHDTIVRVLSLSGIKLSKRKLSDSLPEPIPASVHIIGNGSLGNARGVFLDIGDKMYLFNCGEGLQRLVFEHNIKLSKLENVFITSNKWHNISGLSGLVLSCIDSGVKQVSWHSVPYLNKLHKIWSFFDIKLKNFNVNIIDSSRESFEDNNVEIKSILIHPHPDLDPVFTFICKLHAKSGVFRIDKCFHLKIPRDLVPQLKARKDLVLNNKRIIRAKDVHTPDEDEQTIIIIECPSDKYINSIINNDQLNINQYNNISCIVHFTPEHVIRNDSYQQWIDHFSSDTRHVIINEENPTLSLFHLHRFQSQLNLFDSTIFPMLKESQCDNRERESGTKIYPQSGLKIVLRPSEEKGLNYDNIDQLDIDECQKEVFTREGFSDSFNHFKSQMTQYKKLNIDNDQYPEIVFLGTGSAMPGTFRSVSSILVNITENASMILDCGEDTYGQMCRFYGVSHIKSALSKVKAIFISHIHSDHHCGLLRLMKERYKIVNEPILLLIPPLMKKWLEMYGRNVENISKLYTHKLSPQLSDINATFTGLELDYLRIVPVIHCSHSYGIVLVTKRNRKIVYSGDAIPTDGLIEMGQNCDLLIHEATVEDALINIAKDKNHCTVSQAIDVAKKMNAKFTIFTHFSQRYAKLPLTPDDMGDNIGIAFDFMKVRISDLKILPMIIPSLKCLYAKHIETLKMKEEIHQRRLRVGDIR